MPRRQLSLDTTHHVSGAHMRVRRHVLGGGVEVREGPLHLAATAHGGTFAPMR